MGNLAAAALYYRYCDLLLLLPLLPLPLPLLLLLRGLMNFYDTLSFLERARQDEKNTRKCAAFTRTYYPSFYPTHTHTHRYETSHTHPVACSPPFPKYITMILF